MIKAVRPLMFALVLIATMLIGGSSGKAQEAIDGSNIQVSPLFFELSGKPNDSFGNEITVTNNSETMGQTYSVSLMPFTGTETGQAIITDKEDPAYSLKDWVTFSPSTFALKPKQSQKVIFTIKVATNAEPGGRYGAVLVSTGASPVANGSGASTVQKVGSLVLLTIPGDIRYNAYIKDFNTDQKWYKKLPVTFKIRLHNNSTIHIKPAGFITLNNIFGHKVVDLEVPQKIVLPQEDRFQEVASNQQPLDASLNNTVSKQNLLPGWYTAKLNLNYGSGTGAQTMSTQIGFLYLPWSWIIGIIIALILLIFIIVKRRNFIQALKVIFGRTK